MVNDPIGDFLARIKNAINRKMVTVDAPSTRILAEVASILKQEGYINDFEVKEEAPQNTISLKLKYVNGESAIRNVIRVSKPGRRIYKGYKDINRIKSGLGISIFTTPQGLVTDRKARNLKVGGEHICNIY